ncbi:MAG: hypothetical protein IPG67_14770 [Acidobacteria bacterium]|nr:hypothetical protein [Acidobacteriota bacterium]
MNEEIHEILFDLLTKQATYGLDASEQQQLEELSANLNFRTDDSFDIAAAAIGLADLEIEPMPAHLNANILASADSYFASAESAAGSTERAVETAEADDMQPTFGFEPKRSSLSSWLGWAIAGAACIALAFNVYNQIPRANRDRQRTDADRNTRKSQVPQSSMKRSPVCRRR